MSYRDEMEAAQARIRTLNAELDAAGEAREAAESARRAAEAARDELRLKPTGRSEPRRRVGLGFLAAAVCISLCVLAWYHSYHSASVDRHARELAALRAQ